MKQLLKTCVASICCLALILTTGLAAPAAQGAQSGGGTVSLHIEGAGGTIYAGSPALQAGDSVYDILVHTLSAAGVSYDFPNDPTYGHGTKTIGPDTAADDYSTYWAFYINDQYAPLGIDGIHPADGDNIVLAYSGWNTLYPMAELTPNRPVKSKQATLHLSASYYDMGSNSYQVTDLSGVHVTLNGQTAQTDTTGNAVLTMPAQAGGYDVQVSKDAAGGTPDIVRREIPITVYDSLPAGDDGSGWNLSHEDSIDVCSTGDVAARLDVAAANDGSNVTISTTKTIVVRNTEKDYRLTLAAGTVLTGPAAWDGSFALPQQAAGGFTAPANATVSLAVKVGAPGAVLSLSKPARLVLPGQHGKAVGYFDGAGEFRRAAQMLTFDAAPAGLAPGAAAVYDNGTDLIVYTTVLATFAAYQDHAADAVSDNNLAAAASRCAAALKSDTSRWGAFAMARAGRSPAAGYLDALKTEVAGNGGDYNVPSSLGGMILVLGANGIDPAHFCGINLTEKLYNYDKLDKAGLSGPAWALMALDSKKTAIPSGAKWNAQTLSADILGYQQADGGFSLSKTLASDPDMTAIALAALAPHTGDTQVKAATQKALAWLSQNQKADGGFVSTMGGTSTASSESVSMAVIALCSLGIDPKTDARFVKGTNTMFDSLLSFEAQGGGFEHLKGAGLDTMASEEALMALTAYSRFLSGKNALYDLTDAAGSAAVAADTKAAGSSPVSKSGNTDTNPDTGDSGAPTVAVVLLLACGALLAAEAGRRANTRPQK